MWPSSVAFVLNNTINCNIKPQYILTMLCDETIESDAIESWPEANETMPCSTSQPQKLQKAKRPQEHGQNPTHKCGKYSQVTRGDQKRTWYRSELPGMG